MLEKLKTRANKNKKFAYIPLAKDGKVNKKNKKRIAVSDFKKDELYKGFLKVKQLYRKSDTKDIFLSLEPLMLRSVKSIVEEVEPGMLADI